MGNVTTYRDATAVTGTRYYYAVVALDAAGNLSAASPEAFATSADNGTPADTAPPSAPASLSATDTPSDAGGSIDLAWSAATDNVGVTGYRIRRGTSAGSYDTTFTVGNVTTYHDASAVTGTRYYYAVRAIDAAGNLSVASPEAFATAADNTPPVVPVTTRVEETELGRDLDRHVVPLARRP